jgi:hypothetical protein
MLAPVAGVASLRASSGIGDKAGLDEDRRHIRRLEHHEAGLLHLLLVQRAMPSISPSTLAPIFRLLSRVEVMDRSARVMASVSSLSLRLTPPSRSAAFSRWAR